MSSWMEGLSSHARTVYRLCFGRGSDEPCYITRLSPDILIDLIFPQLLVEELLSLRQVNKPFYLLTHEPVIWRRYLRKLHGIPIAQMRPTFQFLEPIGAYEIEHFVTTACALDRAWRRGLPKVETNRIVVGMHRIIDLKLVPGGKFLVASVKDKENYRFFIMVYAMDTVEGCRLIARLPTFHKVFDLQAKYLEHDGYPGIMITYTRRKFKYGNVRPNVLNLGEFSHRYTPDVMHPLAYEACAVHFRLDVVEPLIGPTMKPKVDPEQYIGLLREMDRPFKDVFRRSFDKEVHAPSLFKALTENFLGFIEGTDKLHIVNLALGVMATMSFASIIPGMPSRIRAFRYIPCQNGLLVVRSASQTPGGTETLYFEFHDFPTQSGEEEFQCDHPWACDDTWDCHGDFEISDSDMLNKKLAPHHPEPLRREECPPTIWVFAPSSTLKGTAYWYFRPQPRYNAYNVPLPGEYHYVNNEANMPFQTFFHHNAKHQERALAGSERSLFVELEQGISDAPPVHRLRRFLYPSVRFPDLYPAPVICEPVTAREEDNMNLTFTDIELSTARRLGLPKGGGLAAITWDENSGKICMAMDNDDNIRVIDLVKVVNPQERLAYKWNHRLTRHGLI